MESFPATTPRRRLSYDGGPGYAVSIPNEGAAPGRSGG